MPSFKKRYDVKKKKETISLLRAFIKLLEDGTHTVETVGTWQGDVGKLNLRITVKEKES